MRNTDPHRLPGSESTGDIILSPTPWQRIEAVIRYYGFPTISAFSRDLGLHRAENLFQIKKGKNGISKKLAEHIAQKYSPLSKIWLLTGEGQMFPSLSDPSSILHNIAAIPYYADFPFRKPPDKPYKTFYCSKEFVGGGEFAVTYLHDVLHPLIKTGSIMILKELKEISKLIYGEVHFVETDDFNVFRIVRRSGRNDRLLLQALQKEKYDDIEIDKASVRAIFRVRAAITML